MSNNRDFYDLLCSQIDSNHCIDKELVKSLATSEEINLQEWIREYGRRGMIVDNGTYYMIN